MAAHGELRMLFVRVLSLLSGQVQAEVLGAGRLVRPPEHIPQLPGQHDARRRGRRLLPQVNIHFLIKVALDPPLLFHPQQICPDLSHQPSGLFGGLSWRTQCYIAMHRRIPCNLCSSFRNVK